MCEVLYIYGAGGHAKVVAGAARLSGWEIGGFVEDHSQRIGEAFFGSAIMAPDNLPLHGSVVVAIGDNRRRLAIGRELQNLGFQLPTVIHPTAAVAVDAGIGIGCFVGAFANIDPGCVIGDFCIVNNSANISHDSLLEDGSHACGGCMVAGHGKIGKASLFGIGSIMIENREIGEDVIVGAGTVVITSLPSKVVAVGCPARIIKVRQN